MGQARLSVHNKTRVGEFVLAFKSARNATHGTTVRNPAVYQDIQKKNLEAFHSRLAELKQAREERVSENEKTKVPDGENKQRPEIISPKEPASLVATTQR